MATYSRRARPFLVLLLLTLSMWFAPACGSSPSAPDTPPAATTPQTTTLTFSGTFQSSNDSYGSVTLTAQVPVALPAATDGVSAPRAIANATK